MNKNLSCGIVRDLLPLYAEGLTGTESDAAVQRHLDGCCSCRAALEQLQQPAPTPQPPAVPLRQVEKAIRARRRKAVILAVCLVLALAVAVVARVTEPHYLAYGENGLAVAAERYAAAPGGTAVQLKIRGRYQGCGTQRILTEENGVMYAEYTVSVWRGPFGSGEKEGTLLLEPVDAQAVRVYFTDYTHEDVLLYGTADGGRQTLPRLVLNYYLLIAAVLAAALGLAALLARKTPRLGRGLAAVWGMPVCYLAAQLAVKGTGGATSDPLRDLGFILLTAALLYAAGALAARLRRERL